MPRNQTRTALAASLVVCLSACCEPQRPKVQPELPRARLLDADTSWERSLPIVDIHGHTFNARYLPMVNIALGKRDKDWYTELLPDPVVVAAAKYISDMAVLSQDDLTPPAAAPELAGLGPEVAKAQVRHRDGLPNDLLQPGGVMDQRKFETRDRVAVRRASQASGVPEPTLDKHPAITAMRKIASAHVRGEVRDALREPEQDPLTPAEHAALACMGIFGEINFLATIVLDDSRRAVAYRHDFQLQDHQILLVSHMMDLGPVYNQLPAPDGLLDFNEQIARMDRFQSKDDDIRVYFVAYNPFRGADCLDIVKNAVGDHHAYGVKVYPPSGYRPTHNQIPGRPIALFSSEPGSQWDARYKGLKAGDLDTRLEQLLQWCEHTQTPVFAHCNTGEFEARKGYGVLMADPKWWGEYLRKHPAPDGGPCRLRLCLGHAGGPDFWFGGGKYEEWGRVVSELCTRYPNVYCEVGVHDEILNARKRAVFVKTLAEKFPESDHSSKEHPYALSGKLMYGTDWFMPGPVDKPAEYLRAYQLAFLEPPLRSYYKRFFLDNAIRYLDIEERLKRQEFPEAVKARLEGIVRTSRKMGDRGVEPARDASAPDGLERPAFPAGSLN